MGQSWHRLPDRAQSAAVLLVAMLSALVVPGAIAGFSALSLPAFDLITELDEGFSLAPLYSALLLSVAGLTAAHCALASRQLRGTLAWAALAVTLVAASVDELLAIHESLEPAAAAGAAEVAAWVALLVIGAAVWLAATANVWSVQAARTPWIAGGLAWAAALVLDQLNSRGAPIVQKLVDGGEEVMELVGTSLLLLAMLCVLEAARASRDRSPSPPTDRRTWRGPRSPR